MWYRARFYFPSHEWWPIVCVPCYWLITYYLCSMWLILTYIHCWVLQNEVYLNLKNYDIETIHQTNLFSVRFQSLESHPNMRSTIFCIPYSSSIASFCLLLFGEVATRLTFFHTWTLWQCNAILAYSLPFIGLFSGERRSSKSNIRLFSRLVFRLGKFLQLSNNFSLSVNCCYGWNLWTERYFIMEA